jgi:hypothetical protein
MQTTAMRTQMNFLAFTACQPAYSLLKTNLETGTFFVSKELKFTNTGSLELWFFQRTQFTGNLLFRPETGASRPIGCRWAERGHKMQAAFVGKKRQLRQQN